MGLWGQAMGVPAIEVVDLGKRYRIGAQRGTYRSYDTLRDALTSTAGLIGRRVWRRGASGTTSGGQERTLWALRHVSFSLEHGEILGVVGQNGSGKSTLLKILTRLTAPSEGHARIHGKVGALLEVGTGLHPELSGRSNIYLKGVIQGMSRHQIRRQFEEIVEFSGVGRFLDTPLKRYSSGMALRLGFAIAAALEPQILLVDEALSVGDLAFQQKCLAKMRRIASSGRTVVFVSHNLRDITALCTRALLLRGGQLVEIADTAAVVARYQASVQPEAGEPLAERTDRSGSGAIRFTAIRIAGEGSYPIQSGKAVVFTLSYQVQDGSRPEGVAFAVKLFDRFGAPMLTCSTYYHGTTLGDLPPAGEIDCAIPSLPLTPGTYQVNLWCGVGDSLADELREAAYVEVLAGDFFGSGRWPDGRAEGPFLVAHEWRLTGQAPQEGQ